MTKNSLFAATCAVVLVLVGLLMLVVRRFAGDYLVDQLTKDDAVEPQDDALILAVSVCIDQMAHE